MLMPADAVRVIEEGKLVGWKSLTKDFKFEAILQDDGTINTYVSWIDDPSGNMANYNSWDEVRTDYDLLVRASAL